jgi:hypothetical protein
MRKVGVDFDSVSGTGTACDVCLVCIEHSRIARHGPNGPDGSEQRTESGLLFLITFAEPKKTDSHSLHNHTVYPY